MSNKDFGFLSVYLGAVRLSGENAYITARVLESVLSAIWRAHGDAMADFQGRAFPDDGCYSCHRCAYNYEKSDDDEPIPGKDEIPY